MITRITRYLSRLDGVEVASTHESGSHYFRASGVKIRVSDHIAFSCNPTTTLNIVCGESDFAVFYGSRLIPLKNYEELKELLRNFIKVCDILAPLAKLKKESKVIEKVVTIEKPVIVPQPTDGEMVSYVPAQNNSPWLYIGDLTLSQKTGAYNNVQNMKKLASSSKKKKK